MKLTALTESVRNYWQGPVSLRDPNLASYFGWPGAQTASGVSVTEQSAMTYSAFWNAIILISGQVATLPLNLYVKTDRGKKVMDWNGLDFLLHDEPNDEMTSLEFRETLQAHVLSWGNGYSEIGRNGRGRVSALWPLTPDRVQPFREVDARNRYGPLMYRIDGQEVLPRSEIFHLRGLAFDGCIGYSPVACARQSIALGIAAERFGSTFYGNGSTFGGILTHPGKLTKEAKQGIRETINERHQGPNKAHQFLILGEGMKYDKLGIPPNDAQFLESRKFQVTEIARWFNLPPHKLKDLERATFSNVEQQTIEFVTDCLNPWLIRWEQAFNRALIPAAERGIQFTKHKVQGLLRGDSQARGEYYSKMFQIGALSINDIRSLEDMDTIGPDGDQYFVQGALVPVDQVQAMLEAKMQPPTPPQAQLPAADTTKQQREQALESLQTIMSELGAVREQQTVTVDALKQLPTREEWTAVDVANEARAAAEHLVAERQAELDRVTGANAGNEALAEARSKQVEELRESLKQAEEGLKAAQDAAETAKSQHDMAANIADQAAARAADAEGRAAAAETALQAVTTEEQTQRAAEKDRLARMLVVHRGLIVDAMGRMVRRETEKARRNQGTPAKLRAWAESFYLLHEDMCVDALLPAIRTHLAWIGSDVSPEQLTRDFLRPQLTAAVQMMRNIADADPEEYQPVLERVLTKWEQERPDALADLVLQKEIDHVRSL